uniref:Uncharacterized protein n=1 Tax=Rhizophora mucronata TaxID=61149 RepID=A0A2P2N8L2_RHIMU
MRQRIVINAFHFHPRLKLFYEFGRGAWI